MDGIALIIGRTIGNKYEIRVPFENIKISNTFPRYSYDYSLEEFNIHTTTNKYKLYNKTVIFLKKDDYIRIAGHIINVKSTIYSKAKSYDVINGWKSLEQTINIRRLFDLFFILDIRDLYKRHSNLEKKVSIITEPRLIILIRLAYWYSQCKKIKSFKEKSKDIHNKLRISNETIKQVKDLGIKSENVKQTIRQINTTISEIMFISMINEMDSEIISFDKKHEFLIGTKIAEVKL